MAKQQPWWERLHYGPLPSTVSGIYQPLDEARQEIRVLTVEPGEFEDELQCSLKVVSLLDTPMPKYETISYHWGHASRRSTLRLHGKSVQVPKSSLAAVRRMRLSSRKRLLWIDAICINQQDLHEKTWQVASMGRVYMNGAGNLIYLGEDETGSGPMAVTTLQRLVKKIQDAAPLLSGKDREDWNKHDMPNCWYQTCLFTITDVELGILERLCSARWFTRLWVVQEIALAPENICHWGSVCFPLSSIVLVISMTVWTASSRNLSRNHGAASFLEPFLHLTKPSKQQEGQTISWPTLYSVATRLSTTEQRDHLFALSGLVQACHYPGQSLSSLIRPDYNKTIDEVFRDATRHVLKTEDDYLLQYVVHESKHDMTRGVGASWCLP